jgi:hypothetical protein
MGGACSMNGEEEKCVYVAGGKARGKEATRRRWLDNIRMELCCHSACPDHRKKK